MTAAPNLLEFLHAHHLQDYTALYSPMCHRVRLSSHSSPARRVTKWLVSTAGQLTQTLLQLASFAALTVSATLQNAPNNDAKHCRCIISGHSSWQWTICNCTGACLLLHALTIHQLCVTVCLLVAPASGAVVIALQAQRRVCCCCCFWCCRLASARCQC